MNTLDNVVECASLVCSDLRIPMPRVTVSQRTASAWYRFKTRRIHIGIKSRAFRLSVEEACLHELAHHVECWRNGGRLAEKRRPHGPTFVTALHDVVVAWYGRTDRYRWDLDYKCVAREAKKRGYY